MGVPLRTIVVPVVTGALASLPLVGCSSSPAATAPDREATGTSTSALVEPNGRTLNGRTLNGRTLNGRTLNGRTLNGRTLNGVSLDGASFGGASLRSLSLDGESLVAHRRDGRVLRGERLIGLAVAGVLDDGTSLPIRIDDVEASTVSGNEDLTVYFASYFTDQGWQPLCEAEDGSATPTGALALAGTWNYGVGVPGGGSKTDDGHTFTFACEGYGLAKCAELGYRPWTSRWKCDDDDRAAWVSSGWWNCRPVPLAPYHQACTRMLRADYCGDGTPHTVDGVLIDVFDGLGIQLDTDTWPVEAEWVPAGASCVAHGRRSLMPACAQPLDTPNCGDLSHFASEALLMDRSPVTLNRAAMTP